MCQVTDRESPGYLDEKASYNFPCKDLQTINSLWLKYSSGRFGFSVQSEIYEGLGGTIGFDGGVLDRFFEEVGWKKRNTAYFITYEEYNFNLNAPKGHLPSHKISWVNRKLYITWEGRHLFYRVAKCNLANKYTSEQNIAQTEVTETQETNKHFDNQLLSKTTGVNYYNLRTFLEAANWKEADLETHRVMLQAIGKENEKELEVEDISKFPCEDLRIINKLWLEKSGKKFGFSVQKNIYMRLEENEDEFREQVGWSKRVPVRNLLPIPREELVDLPFSKLTFSLDAPIGHLPSEWVFHEIILAELADNCNL